MSVWEDMLEVVGVGIVAGIGVSIAFAFALGGVVRAGVARREGRGGTAALHAAVAVLAGLVCVAAVVGALVTMLDK